MMSRLLRTINVPRPWVTAVLGLCCCVLAGVRPAAAGNVVWSFVDQVAACPAGDTTFVAGHPSRLRVSVMYYDGAGQPRDAVPPESIWVNVSTSSGNVVLNDATKATVPADQWAVYADAPTDSGAARVTVVSMSGCGTLRLRLWVSGVNQGTRTATVRTVDSNADGRVNSSDVPGACDVNYNGLPDDSSLVYAHPNHWHRNALFGMLVRCTFLCDTCTSGLSDNYIGVGDISWSPDGRYVTYSRRQLIDTAPATCTVFYVPSDPADGQTPTKFSFPADHQHDYDPSWSPLGTEIVWDRRDRQIIRKGIFGLNPDTTEHVILEAATYGLPYATEVSVSPNGKLVAFTAGTATGQRVFTVPITGGAPTQITTDPSGTGNQQWPQWSPDGTTIVFWKDGTWDAINTVPATGGQSTPFYAPTDRHARFPSYSPDALTILGSIGTAADATVTHALEVALPGSPPLIPSYAEYTGAFISAPHYSPDGTRVTFLARPPGATIGSPQVWASRRNMSKPPVITTLAGQALNPATPFVDLTAPATNSLQFTVDAVDPEADAIYYDAYFVRTDLGMHFDKPTRTFSWTAPQSEIGNTYNVKFVAMTTANGGTAYGIARITVGLPYDLVIQNQTFTGTTLEEAINSITAGPAVTVTNTGNVTFHVTNGSGTGIRLLDGFWAQQGGSFRAYLGSGGMGPSMAARPKAETAVEKEKTVSDAGSSPVASSTSRALAFALQPNQPNPFVASTIMRFTIPSVQRVRLEVFDLQGHRVSTIADQSYPAGAHWVSWNRRDDSGRRVAAGVYFVRMEAGLYSTGRKLVVLD